MYAQKGQSVGTRKKVALASATRGRAWATESSAGTNSKALLIEQGFFISGANKPRPDVMRVMRKRLSDVVSLIHAVSHLAGVPSHIRL